MAESSKPSSQIDLKKFKFNFHLHLKGKIHGRTTFRTWRKFPCSRFLEGRSEEFPSLEKRG
jgi:hypothetical protein